CSGVFVITHAVTLMRNDTIAVAPRQCFMYRFMGVTSRGQHGNSGRSVRINAGASAGVPILAQNLSELVVHAGRESHVMTAAPGGGTGAAEVLEHGVGAVVAIGLDA